MSTKRDKTPMVCKMYINGKFCTSNPIKRILDAKNDVVVKMAQATTADFSKAVAAARSGYKTWKATSPALRAAQLYVLAEAMEQRSVALTAALEEVGMEAEHAIKEVRQSIKRLFWYAGWCDKLPQVYSSVNPVMVPYVSVTTTEAAGVVAIFAPEVCPLLGVVSALLPVLVAGNSAVLITHPKANPEALQPFFDALNATELPPGLINIVHGEHLSLAAEAGGSTGVDAIAIHKDDPKLIQAIRDEACKSLKHMEIYDDSQCDFLHSKEGQSPYRILPFVEFKTTWHPCAPLESAGSNY